MQPEGYRVNEMFWTIQGEGYSAGRTAVFVRLQGCPVGCPWCDSKLTWGAGGEYMAVEAIMDRVFEFPSAELVVITGGEPLLYDLDPLLAAIASERPGKPQIETSGAYPFKGKLRPDWLTVSPKHAARWKVAPNVLERADELKYVIDENYDEAITFLHLAARLKMTSVPTPLVYLMPEGSPPRPEMVERAMSLLSRYPRWRFGPRLQYAYPTIAEAEGLNNKIISVEEARARSRAHVEAR